MTEFLPFDVSAQISTTKELPLLPSYQTPVNKSESFKTSDLSQLTTVLQRDIEGKSYLFSQCPTVLIPLLCEI